MTSTNDMRVPLRVAVLGAGEWAQKYHLPSLKILEAEIPFEIAGIWNRTRETAEQAARHFSIGRVYYSLHEILEDRHLDCFVVLVNSSALLETVSKLLSRGLPIFTEKPPGRSYQESLMLADLVTVTNLVAFNRRYMPINRRFKEQVNNIKGAYFAECRFYRNERHYDHFVLETGVHGINYMEYLFGPVISAQTRKGKNPSNDSSYWITWAIFESGMQGIFKFFPCSGSNVERYEVHGQDTSIYLRCPQTYTIDHPGEIVIHEKGKHVSSIFDDESEGPLLTSGFLNEYRDFFLAVRNGSPTVSNFRNACNTMKVAEAIEETTDITNDRVGYENSFT
jgi:predicted dehydrogenase